MKKTLSACLFGFLILQVACELEDEFDHMNLRRGYCSLEFVRGYSALINNKSYISSPRAYISQCDQFDAKFSGTKCKALVRQSGDVEAKERTIGADDLKPDCDRIRYYLQWEQTNPKVPSEFPERLPTPTDDTLPPAPSGFRDLSEKSAIWNRPRTQAFVRSESAVSGLRGVDKEEFQKDGVCLSIKSAYGDNYRKASFDTHPDRKCNQFLPDTSDEYKYCRKLMGDRQNVVNACFGK